MHLEHLLMYPCVVLIIDITMFCYIHYFITMFLNESYTNISTSFR